MILRSSAPPEVLLSLPIVKLNIEVKLRLYLLKMKLRDQK